MGDTESLRTNTSAAALLSHEYYLRSRNFNTPGVKVSEGTPSQMERRSGGPDYQETHTTIGLQEGIYMSGRLIKRRFQPTKSKMINSQNEDEIHPVKKRTTCIKHV